MSQLTPIINPQIGERVLNEEVNNGNYYISIEGENKRLKDWFEYFGISRDLYYSRIASGLSQQEALSKPHNTKLWEYNKKKMTLKEWSYEMNIGYSILKYRIKRGWSIKKALETPVKEYNK